MNIQYQSYFKIIVQILKISSEEVRDKILDSQQSFYEWLKKECLITETDMHHELYAEIKDFIEKTCKKLRFSPDLIHG
jgi:hypothetical protein